MMAAALGNYPTPIVGYGGSAVIGYVFSLLALPKLVMVGAGNGSLLSGPTEGAPIDRHLRLGTA